MLHFKLSTFILGHERLMHAVKVRVNNPPAVKLCHPKQMKQKYGKSLSVAII